MTEIYVVVHPEARHHVDGIVGGWFDSELTDRGVDQAHRIAASLAGGPAVIFSSDLLRARRTAEIIADRLASSVTIDRDLREKSYGEAEGRPKAWLEQRRIPLPEAGDRLRHNEGPAGAETRMDVGRRAYAAMNRVRAASGDRRIVVTHGGTATFLIASWIGLPIEASGLVDFRTSAGSITVLRKDPRTFSHQVVRLNDVSHLN